MLEERKDEVVRLREEVAMLAIVFHAVD